MCTAIFDKKYGVFFGRTLDLECSYGERVMRVTKGDTLHFIHQGEHICKYSLIGMAYDADSQPLFYDAINDKGLCTAALNFPLYAEYQDKKEGAVNLASFEVILYILSQCANIGEVKSILENAVITDDNFSHALQSTPLHWMFADRTSCIVVESVKEGLKIYDNPFGIMTNSPPFPYHTARLCDFAYLSPEPQDNNILSKQNLTPYSRGLGAYGLPGDYSSSSRFVRAVFAKEHTLLPRSESDSLPIPAEQQRIFDILGTISLPYGIARTESGEPIYTVYTSCIDMGRCEYSYFTYNDRNIKVFKF